MGRLRSELVIKLVDDVSGKAGKVSKALALAEKQTKALAAAAKAGMSDRLASQLQRVGASAREIDRVTEAWQRYSRAQGLAARSKDWTKEQLRGVKEWERANLAAIRSVQAAQARPVYAAARRASPSAPGSDSRLALAAARVAAPAALGYAGVRAVKDFASAERTLVRIGVTADATDGEISGIGATAMRIAQQVALPYDKVISGLDVLVTQGRNLKDSLDFLPSIARTAQASGADVDDIAKSADTVGTNFKIAGREMQTAFDIMAAGGKAGQFELKDMARYLPSLSPAASAAGFTGQMGISDLVAMLQIARKGTGTSEEAVSSMNNIFQKMESDETTKNFKKFGVDLAAGMAKGRKEGRNLVAVLEDLTSTALKGDLSKLPQLFNDMEFARGMRALMTYRGEWQKLSAEMQKTARGTVGRDLERVTAGAQAKLDRLANTWSRTMRNAGAILSSMIEGPLDKLNTAVERAAAASQGTPEGKAFVEAGQKKFNRFANAVWYGLDSDAPGYQGNDARQAKLDRDKIDARRDALNREIDKNQGFLKRMPRPEFDKSQGWSKKIEALRAELNALNEAVSGHDRANVELIEVEEQQKRLRGLSIDKARRAAPRPIQPGLTQFGFGRYGTPTDTALPPWLPPPQVSVPLPPVRPVDVPSAAPLLQKLEDVLGGVKAELTGSAEVKGQATLDVRFTGGDGLIRIINDQNAKIMRLEGKVDAATNAMTSGGSASTGIVQSTMDGLHANTP